jgi:hypothetical protein
LTGDGSGDGLTKKIFSFFSRKIVNNLWNESGSDRKSKAQNTSTMAGGNRKPQDVSNVLGLLIFILLLNQNKNN